MEGKGLNLIRSMSRHLPRVGVCEKGLQPLLWACSRAAHVKIANVVYLNSKITAQSLQYTYDLQMWQRVA
jgi:hypothetical protein